MLYLRRLPVANYWMLSCCSIETILLSHCSIETILLSGCSIEAIVLLLCCMETILNTHNLHTLVAF